MTSRLPQNFNDLIRTITEVKDTSNKVIIQTLYTRHLEDIGNTQDHQTFADALVAIESHHSTNRRGQPTNHKTDMYWTDQNQNDFHSLTTTIQRISEQRGR